MAGVNISSSTTSAAEGDGRSPRETGNTNAEGLVDDRVFGVVNLGKQRSRSAQLPGGAFGDRGSSGDNPSVQRQGNMADASSPGRGACGSRDTYSHGQSNQTGNSTAMCQETPTSWLSLYQEANDLYWVSRRHLSSSLLSSPSRSRLGLDSMRESLHRLELELHLPRNQVNDSSADQHPGYLSQGSWASPATEVSTGHRGSISRTAGIQRSPLSGPWGQQLDGASRSSSHELMVQRKNERNAIEMRLGRLYGGSYSTRGVGPRANIYDYAEPIVRTPSLMGRGDSESDFHMDGLSSRNELPRSSFMDFARFNDYDDESNIVDDSSSEDGDSLILSDNVPAHSSLLHLHEELNSHPHVGTASSAASSLWHDCCQATALSGDPVSGGRQSTFDLASVFSDSSWPCTEMTPPPPRDDRNGFPSWSGSPRPEKTSKRNEDKDGKRLWSIQAPRGRKQRTRKSSLKAVRKMLFRRLDVMEPNMVNEIMLALDYVEPDDLYALASMSGDSFRQTMREVAANLAASFERDTNSVQTD